MKYKQLTISQLTINNMVLLRPPICGLRNIIKYNLITLLFIVSLLIVNSSFSFAITGDEVINKIDANMTFATARFESKMIIHVGSEIREKELVSYEKGKDAAFAEFLSPARDKGVKYLKLTDNMWMYMPSVDKIIKIAGHMLRQSMMGSDFSYEDALESSKLLDKYTAKLVAEEIVPLTFVRGTQEVVEQRKCYVVDLTAKVKDVTYFKRKIWADEELFVPVKEELFAMSGKKLKVSTVGNVQKFGARYYPMYFSMSNMLRENSKTEMVITKAQFDISVPANTFTQGNLTK